MKLKHNDILVEKEFPFKNCRLKREKYASVLSKIVENYADSFVLAINNEWGTGKTTFIKMWEQQLKNQDFKTLYFNAWENDFENDVFVAIISELQELKQANNEKLFNTVLHKAGPLVKSLGLGLIKTQIENFTGEDFFENVLNINKDILSKNLEEQILLYKNRKESIVEFKNCLERYVSQTINGKPIVFFIDELDRCRPNYAVEVIEQIKQIFSVNGIVFVLCIDKIQLCHAIRGVYGSENINAEEYLRRFIDIEYCIPNPSSKLFCDYLYEYFQFSDFFRSSERIQFSELNNDDQSFLKVSCLLFDHCKLPLRAQEKIFAHARLALCLFSHNQFVLPNLFVFLIFLRNHYRSTYEGIKNNQFTMQVLLDKVEEILPQNLIEYDLRAVINTLSLLLVTYYNGDKSHQIESLIIQDENIENSHLIVKSRIDKSPNNQTLLDHVRNLKGRMYYHDLSINQLITRIELTEQFSNI